jgi:hypothetical protein
MNTTLFKAIALTTIISVILNIILFSALQDMSKQAAYHLRKQTELEKLTK